MWGAGAIVTARNIAAVARRMPEISNYSGFRFAALTTS